MTKSRIGACLSIGFIAAPLAAIAAAPGLEKVSIVETSKMGKFEVLLEDRNAGRLVYYFTFKADNKQVEGGDLFDASTNTGGGFADLVKGAGPVNGFDLYQKDGDIYKVGWAGSCAKSVVEGRTVDQCSGGWTVIPASGTGRFAGLSGGGQWRSHSLPNGDYIVEKTGALERR